jgi:hypothetical protein
MKCSFNNFRVTKMFVNYQDTQIYTIHIYGIQEKQEKRNIGALL